MRQAFNTPAAGVVAQVRLSDVRYCRVGGLPSYQREEITATIGGKPFRAVNTGGPGAFLRSALVEALGASLRANHLARGPVKPQEGMLKPDHSSSLQPENGGPRDTSGRTGLDDLDNQL